VNGDVLVTRLPDVLEGECIVDALDLLKTEYVRAFFGEQPFDQINS
jgi:hypothetical protein